MWALHVKNRKSRSFYSPHTLKAQLLMVQWPGRWGEVVWGGNLNKNFEFEGKIDGNWVENKKNALKF